MGSEGANVIQDLSQDSPGGSHSEGLIINALIDIVLIINLFDSDHNFTRLLGENSIAAISVEYMAWLGSEHSILLFQYQTEEQGNERRISPELSQSIVKDLKLERGSKAKRCPQPNLRSAKISPSEQSRILLARMCD